MFEVILGAILALPPAQYPQGYDPETAAQREARMGVVAAGIDAAVRQATCTTLEPVEGCTPWWNDGPEALAAMLVTMAWYETKFVLRVHEGKCRRDECDALRLGNGDVIHRARGLWQVQRNPRVVSRDEWAGLVGTSEQATTTAAVVAARVLVQGRARCAANQTTGWEAPAVAAYATGRSCTWSRAAQRVATYRRVLKSLRAPAAAP